MVPKDPKEIVQSLVENHTKGSKAEGDTEFDNIIQGKGQNVVILLQYESTSTPNFHVS